MNTQIEVLAGQVEQGFGQHPDAEIYLSQPGLGVILGARVLAEFGDDPDRYADAKARKNYAGMSPDHPSLRHQDGSCWPATPATGASATPCYQQAFCALTRLTRRPRLLRPAPRPRRHPPPSPARPRQPARRHPPRLPAKPHPLRRAPAWHTEPDKLSPAA